MIIHDMEQNSPEWDKVRSGKPTASEFSKLITSTGAPSDSLQKYAEKLACDLWSGHDIYGWEGNRYTERGHEVEDEAAGYYEMITGNTTETVGFITDDMLQYGASPDRLVGDDGLLEIKCLPRLHFEAIKYTSKHKTCPPDFVAQTQGQLLVTERQWCDLLLYHRTLPKVIIRVERNDMLIRALKEQIKACLAARRVAYRLIETIQESL